MGPTVIPAPRAGKVRSLPELLRRRAEAQPDERAYTFLEDGERQGAQLTWGTLERRSRAVASEVAAHASSGSRALILCPPGLDVIPAFFGALGAGAIAVPCYPPRISRVTPADQRDRTLDRLRAIVRDARPRVVLATAAMVDRAVAICAAVPGLLDATWLSLDNCGADHSPDASCAIDSDAVAFLQYTSGSTAEPRGVMVTHANLLHNLADAHALAQHGRDAASVSWLPVIHDMGLIQGVLQGAFSGFPSWLMSPAAFLQRPARWLEAIARTRATISGGPNFAYELCTRRITTDERSALDLRSWHLAFNGAEPIRQASLDAFAKAFGPCGFDARAFRPCYGLAEATLLVSMGAGATSSCGAPPRSTQVRIVNPVTLRECPAGICGEIWIAGPGVTAGYWNQPEASRSTFDARIANTEEGPFLRSGDLGSIGPEGLRITGRIKDILIVRGMKHAPQDIEETVERASPLLRAGCCAVFALPGVDEDLVGVAAELEAGNTATGGDSIISGIREAVGSAHGIQVSLVALIAPGTIPKTTSGKLQRFACREGLLDGWLTPVSFWADSAAQLAEA
jgi:acyl-CoA synthetase (AMP-forming)/AMP-acid ligase II